MLMTLTPFPELIIYIGFSLTVFTVLAVFSVFVFRRRSEWQRLRSGEFSFPLVPASYILVGVCMIAWGIIWRPAPVTSPALVDDRRRSRRVPENQERLTLAPGLIKWREVLERESPRDSGIPWLLLVGPVRWNSWCFPRSWRNSPHSVQIRAGDRESFQSCCLWPERHRARLRKQHSGQPRSSARSAADTGAHPDMPGG